jgi:hypothetical protein
MENLAFVESLRRDIITPGVDRLMNNRFFTELRQGKLSQRFRAPTLSLQPCHQQGAGILHGEKCQ